MEKRLSLKAMLIVSALCTGNQAFADMAGAYRITNNGCAPNLMILGERAEVRTPDTEIFVETMAEPRFDPSEKLTLQYVFHMRVADRTDACDTGACVTRSKGMYNSNKDGFLYEFWSAKFNGAPFALLEETEFNLKGSTLVIIDNGAKCLLEKVSR